MLSKKYSANKALYWPIKPIKMIVYEGGKTCKSILCCSGIHIYEIKIQYIEMTNSKIKEGMAGGFWDLGKSIQRVSTEL